MLSSMEPGLLKSIPAFPRFPNPAIGRGWPRFREGMCWGCGVCMQAHVFMCVELKFGNI